MAHEIESLFSYHEVPWHGLGRVLDKPPTIEEGIIQAGLDWKVRTQDTFTEIGENKVLLPNKATVRESDGKVLGVVGPSYTPVQNSEAFEFFQPALEEGLISLETAGSLRGGRRIWVLAAIKGLNAEVMDGDVIKGYFLLSNSHDGTMAVKVGFTAVRVVCANTEHMAHAEGRFLRVRHTSNVKDALTKIQGMVNFASQSFEASIEDMRTMVRKGVCINDVKQYVTRVFKPQVLDETMIFHGDKKSESEADRILSKVIPLFENSPSNNLPGMQGTAWAAYNAVTEFLSHERGRNQNTRVDSLWFGDSQKLLARAHKEALKLAA